MNNQVLVAQMPVRHQSEWLTATEAAQYLRVAHRTILDWAKTGKIPAHRLSGTRRCTWRFRADELDGAIMAAPSAAKNGETFDATGK
jgi:excisionase family DNA binding protein